jgi:lycopene cyclase domain-containing protein
LSYTVLAALAIVGAVALDQWVLATRLLTDRVFWTAYAIVLFFQLVTNGWLTGRGIVTYDARPGIVTRSLVASGTRTRLVNTS